MGYGLHEANTNTVAYFYHLDHVVRTTPRLRSVHAGFAPVAQVV